MLSPMKKNINGPINRNGIKKMTYSTFSVYLWSSSSKMMSESPKTMARSTAVSRLAMNVRNIMNKVSMCGASVCDIMNKASMCGTSVWLNPEKFHFEAKQSASVEYILTEQCCSVCKCEYFAHLLCFVVNLHLR